MNLAIEIRDQKGVYGKNIYKFCQSILINLDTILTTCHKLKYQMTIIFYFLILYIMIVVERNIMCLRYSKFLSCSMAKTTSKIHQNY